MKIRTGYSFRTAVGSIDDVMSRVKELGWGVAPISDRASTFGYVRWRKAAKKAELRPIYGVELAVTSSLHAKKPSVDWWTFYAINDLVHVNELVRLASEQFRYQPMLTYEQALAAQGVIIVMGHRPLLEFVKPQDNLFMALAPSTARGLFNEAKKAGHKFIATGDNYYARQEDKSLYEVLVGRNASTQTWPQWIVSDDEWRASVAWAGEETISDAIATRNSVMASIVAELKQGVLLSPPKTKTLLELCIEGAKELNCDLNDPVYSARLQRELALIAEKKFEDYFFIIADMMQWAHKQMICGPARGSSCGSLVCYLLRITTVDPIPYGLIFERFIDTTRSDLPDIDLDFSDTKRHLVFEYMEQKYGRERVARLGTVALYKPRSAIAEAGAALDVPRWRTDKILDSLVERSSGDSRALQVMEDTFTGTPAGQALIEEYPELRIAQKMEGHPRHSSQHAAGIVLTQEPVTHYIAIDSRVGATQCDKKDAEELNLLKIDALGLTQLSVFEDALSMAGLPMDHLETVPLDDPAAFDVINQGRFSGIFQFNGIALQSIAKSIKTRNLEDIISTTALARPGPMATGGTAEWVKRKRGEAAVVYPHELLEPYLNNTMGIVTYQEQVMEISRNVGDLSWDDVTALRKAMSKSLGKEFFNKYGDPWKAAAIKKGIPPERAEKIWDDLCAYGSWSFNRSHAVAYGIVSYWCCWLKAHHPFEFAAATLQHEKLPAKQISLLREMQAEGIDYVPVDAQKSTDKWQAAVINGKKVLVGPVQNVKGIGPKMVSQIVSSRARGEPLPSRAQKLLANPKTDIDSLWPIRDAFERIMPDPAARGIITAPRKLIDVQANGTDQEVLVFVVAKQIKPRDENELVNVAKRGYKLNGPTDSLNLWIMDDTDTIFAKVNRFDYARIGKEIVERGKPGKALYAIKGKVPLDFRMISVKQIRYIGDLEDDKMVAQEKGGQHSKLKAGEQNNDEAE